MNYTTFLKLSVLIMLPLLMLGCFEDHAAKYHLDDINQVEWAPPDRSSSSLSYTAELEANQAESKTLEFEVQLIGAQTDSDRSVSVDVADTDADEGTHFQVLNSDVTIPANSNHGTVEVEILAENVQNGEEFYVILELQEGSELGVAVNMKDLTLNVEKAED